MRYTLAVLTHGDNADVLERTIRSFDAHVSPPPVERIVVQDGQGALTPLARGLQRLSPVGATPWTSLTLDPPRGFCGATRALWAEAAASLGDYVFWLEHDFEFLRPVDLAPIADVLDAEPDLAQVSLMRGPVNDERRAGGVVGKHQARGYAFTASDDGGPPWLRHRAYLTTTPSLMTRRFMAANPWPPHKSECEGRFGIDLLAAGWSFGVWGDGSPWVEHHGTRTGFGY